MTSELPETAITVETGESRAKRRKNSARRAEEARRAAQDADCARLSLKKGERAFDLRTLSAHAETEFSIFLREFRAWCVSEEARLLVQRLPILA